MTDARTNSRTVSDMPRIGIGYALMLAAVVAYGLHALLVAGPALHAAAEQHLARAIAEEDHDVCGSFGIRPGTAQFLSCSRALAIIRQRQSDRDNAAAQGIL